VISQGSEDAGLFRVATYLNNNLLLVLLSASSAKEKSAYIYAATILFPF
jgi:hypothetical protein